jgi:hypothetical protein
VITPVVELVVVMTVGVIATYTLPLPLDDTGGPGQAAAEDDEQDQVTALEAAFARGFVERDGDGRG